ALLFMSVTLTGKAPYKKVIGFGMLVNEDGAKFSKTGSNNILMDSACDKFGADVIRYMFAANNMLADTRFGEGVVEEVKRKFMGLWNSYVFFNTYAVLDNPNLDGYKPKFNTLDKTDQWLVVRTNALKAFAENAYNTNTLYLLTKEVENFIDDLSNWYIRINRKRFWKGENQTDKLNAYYSLYGAIKTLCQILAPITPYMTEYIWQNLVRELEPNEAESILLSSFPKAEVFETEKQVLTDTEIVRNIITLAQRLRNENNLKVKQPLSKMYISANSDVQNAVLKFENIIKEELNIKEILFEENIDVFNTQYLAVNFKNAGRVLKGAVQNLKTVLEEANAESMQKYMAQYANGAVTIEPFGTLDKDIFVVQAKPKQEFVIATENMITVVLDTNLTEELVEEGIFRELVRVLQVVRKDAGFNVEDRIKAKFVTNGTKLASVLEKYIGKIMQDVLITEILEEGEFDFEKTVEIAGETINIFVKK
ncbi:MAG: class I tRNA ligase family protein, partial [Clostridia bacterium]|nr:class I tRNA ligase family protein [Clostridia bacterium]